MKITRRLFLLGTTSLIAVSAVPLAVRLGADRVPLGKHVPPEFLKDPRWIGNLNPSGMIGFGFISHGN